MVWTFLFYLKFVDTLSNIIYTNIKNVLVKINQLFVFQQAPPADTEVNLHFIAFVHVDDALYELGMCNADTISKACRDKRHVYV